MLLVELIMGNLSPVSTADLLMTISTFTLTHVTLFTQNFPIIFSQALRMRKTCSKKSVNVGKLNDWFKERGYPEDMVNKETKKTLESPSLARSKTSERSVSGNCGTSVPLVVNYNPIRCRLGQVIRKNLCFLYQD